MMSSPSNPPEPYKTSDMVLATCLSMAGLPFTLELMPGGRGRSALFVFPSSQNVLLGKTVSDYALGKHLVNPSEYHRTLATVREKLMSWLDDQAR